MEEITGLFAQFLGPASVGIAVIAIVNWFKMLPGAQNPNLSALWPPVAGLLGAGFMLLYSWVMFGLSDNKQIATIAVVGLFLGLAAAGLYKLADKISK